MKFYILNSILISFFTIFSGLVNAGLISNLYQVNGQEIRLVNNSGAIATWSLANTNFAVAVTDSIYTGGRDNISSKYSLDGTYQSDLSVPGVNILDGATDGNHFYGVCYITSCAGNVYSFDQSWGNRTLLFNSGANDNVGITFDNLTNSLWLSSFGTNQLVNFSLGGEVLSTINISSNGANRGLALDYADNTLWLSSDRDLIQYSKDGTKLSTISNVGYSQGLEAQYVTYLNPTVDVPEPSTLAIFALGIMGLASRRFKK